MIEFLVDNSSDKWLAFLWEQTVPHYWLTWLDVLQGTGQGRILAPFMYKVYINELLNELTQHSCALSLNSISLTSPSFADDITLLSIYHTFLSTLHENVSQI